MKKLVEELQQTEEDLQARILEFVTFEDYLDPSQRHRIRDAFKAGDDPAKELVARELLDSIQQQDVGLAEDLKEYAPHMSNRVALVRALLFEGLERAVLATQPIPTINMMETAA